MKNFILLNQLMLLVHYAASLADHSSMCLLNPVGLEAGLSLISARITDTHAGPCSVSLHFENSSFLPITYTFQPPTCVGAGLVNFVVPLESPSGEAYITFQCAGETLSCARALITGGHSDVDLAIPSLAVVCEATNLDKSVTNIVPTTASFPLATPDPHSGISFTTAVTKYITDNLIGSKPVTTLTITITDEVIRNQESATHTHDMHFATGHIVTNTPTTQAVTKTSTQTHTKTQKNVTIGTIGSIGTISPRATQINSKLNLAVVTSTANTIGSSLLGVHLLVIVYWLF
ncbi:hypothetical protein FPRO06_11977 [Fusarium proliferatum]|nr:hypothetical protein FPRO06_11977 [Fusarium proliferatum]CVL13586.1 uncharacterized protein FPRN_06975 [Fusarium proliferatum]